MIQLMAVLYALSSRKTEMEFALMNCDKEIPKVNVYTKEIIDTLYGKGSGEWKKISIRNL